jgi:hypothetical protein
MEDIQDLLDGLKRAPRILSAFVQTIPQDKLDRKRGEGFWTITEHVNHLAQVQPMLLARLERFMKEEHPEFVPFIPINASGESVPSPAMSTTSALNQFADFRAKQLVILADADDIAWQKTATHPEYTSYSLYILTRHILMHDYWHMYRMEELWLTKDAFLTKLE